MDSTILETKKLVFELCGLKCYNFEIEKESKEYCAAQFEINNQKILFRVAKITPTKTGQFVTLWKRKNEKGVIVPFEVSDNIDLFVINVKKESFFGQFVFPKSILIKKGIISDKKEGKRAIRVYPAWDFVESKQAQQTQKWQLDYFFSIPYDDVLDTNEVRKLYLKIR